MMRNMAPAEGDQGDEPGELVRYLGDAAHQLQEGVGTRDGDAGQFLTDPDLHLAQEAKGS